MVGHSFGQLKAFCIAGSLSLLDALTLVVERASLIHRYCGSEQGSMVSLQADRRTVDQILQSLKVRNSEFYAKIACYNSPKSHVFVGSTRAIKSLEQHITNSLYLRDFVRSKRLRVTHGFHSKFTEPMLPHLTALAKQLDWRHPVLHLETCDDGSGITEPYFRIVSDHTRFPVFFQQAVERLTMRFSQITWVKAGCRSSVMQLVQCSVPGLQGQLANSNAPGSLVDISIKL